MVEDKAMSACEFRDDDAGYLAWIAVHPDGYVINIARSHSVTEARVHRADCRTISGPRARGGVWTALYVKVCAEELAELEQWAIDQVGEPIRRCGACRPARDAVQPTSAKLTEHAVAPPVPEGRFKIQGPAADSPVVEAWADGYIRFERRPVWQKRPPGRDQDPLRAARTVGRAGAACHVFRRQEVKG